MKERRLGRVPWRYDGIGLVVDLAVGLDAALAEGLDADPGGQQRLVGATASAR